ncbi:MAG TPA: cytochrome c [Gammaproteobacteria bacterium]|nr:cytochrome c [Gammaproteobacteria bacterium]
MRTTWLSVLTLVCLAGAGAARAQPPEHDAQLAQGKRVYDYWCVPCHGPGLGLPGFNALPGTQQLEIKYRGTNVSPLLEERTDLVPEFVKVIVRQGVSFMPQFRKTEISDAELEAMAAYLARNNPPVR